MNKLYPIQGSPQVLRTWRDSSKFEGGGGRLKLTHWGGRQLGGLKKVVAISLQACKFTKNELLHIHFSRIIARFSVIIYCTFSRNHFMEGCFTFPWGCCFSDGGSFIVKWGMHPIVGASILMGEG